MKRTPSFALVALVALATSAPLLAQGTFRITPVRPVAELRQEALKATPPAEAGPFKASDLVELATLDSTFRLDIRYATTNNFLSTPLYEQARAFLQRPAAEALVRVSRALRAKGYGILIHDAYRPWYITKVFWDATPPDKHDFVANPADGSRHNRGCAVDLTLYRLAGRSARGNDEWIRRDVGASLPDLHRRDRRAAATARPPPLRDGGGGVHGVSVRVVALRLQGLAVVRDSEHPIPGDSGRPAMTGAYILLLLATPLAAQQPARRSEPAAVPVRYVEGTVHGFLELHSAGGALLATGDLLQVAGDRAVDSRLVFHFADSSVFEETVTFTQHGVFTMLAYHLMQSGPAFAADLTVTLSRSGQYVVKAKSHEGGAEKQYTGTLALPPDTYNGMAITIAKNLVTRQTQTVHMVAFTPEPRLIGLEIAPIASERVMLGQHAETAVHFKLKPELGALLRVFATLAGKAPPNSDLWIVTDDVPAFWQFEGPLYSGPVWRLNQTMPIRSPEIPTSGPK